jgi:peroxiredoxin
MALQFSGAYYFRLARFVFFLGLSLLLALNLALPVFAMGEISPGRSPAQKPRVAPDFTLKDLFGNEVKLSSLRGKVILLNFWATWCPPCRNEMPHLQELYQTLRGKDFEMLAVSIDYTGKNTVAQFINNNGYTFRVLLDVNNKAASLYNVTGIPATFIIDKKGRIVESVVGYRQWADPEVIKQIEGLLRL